MPVPAIDLLYVVSDFSVGMLVAIIWCSSDDGGWHRSAVCPSTKATGTVVHATARTIDWLLVSLLAMGSIPATIVTLVLLSWFDLKSAMAQHTITISLGVVLLATAVFLLAGRRIRENYAARLNVLDQRSRSFCTVVLGFVMGVLVTLTSVGAGAIGCYCSCIRKCRPVGSSVRISLTRCR
jgi:hypothetical protein